MAIQGECGDVFYDPLDDVDESTLSKVDRLGLAYCRFNRWGWDEIAGPKPEGFDGLPDHDRYSAERISHPFIMFILSKLLPAKYAKRPTKHDFISPIMRGIESEIGEANTSRCWWIYVMKRTEEDWRSWYYNQCFRR